MDRIGSRRASDAAMDVDVDMSCVMDVDFEAKEKKRRRRSVPVTGGFHATKQVLSTDCGLLSAELAKYWAPHVEVVQGKMPKYSTPPNI
jgi:hypothetical protein